MAQELPALAPKATDEIKRLFDEFDAKSQRSEDSALLPAPEAIAPEPAGKPN